MTFIYLYKLKYWNIFYIRSLKIIQSLSKFKNINRWERRITLMELIEKKRQDLLNYFFPSDQETFHPFSGLILLDQSRTFQQTTIRIFHAHYTEWPLPSESYGGDRDENEMELRVYHIRREQLRNKGEFILKLSDKIKKKLWNREIKFSCICIFI